MKALFHVGLSAALVAAAALVFFPAVTYAQKDAGAKARGEHSVPFWSSRSSARRISAAHDYARDFQRYVAANPKPNPAVVKEVTTEIGKNLDEDAAKRSAQSASARSSCFGVSCSFLPSV